eukprot:GHVU01140465.1.p2 GENE.GHVU01140465.1~~GHVU01140465.1.p2  ORF type:complete len:150 (-),score=1.36 GHVU01140465.1:26-475(-)
MHTCTEAHMHRGTYVTRVYCIFLTLLRSLRELPLPHPLFGLLWLCTSSFVYAAQQSDCLQRLPPSADRPTDVIRLLWFFPAPLSTSAPSIHPWPRTANRATYPPTHPPTHPSILPSSPFHVSLRSHAPVSHSVTPRRTHAHTHAVPLHT